jgi:glycosyltransferase involved in cell wall biosynthesis
MSLSIVIPCYNVVEKIGPVAEALRQIRDQRIEVVFLDDGSTDATAALLERLSTEIRIPSRVISGQFFGPGAARNAGLKAATGDYVWFVDADDAIFVAPVEKHLDAILQAKVDVAGFAVHDPEDAFERCLSYGHCHSRLYRRSFLDGSGIRFGEQYNGEDSVFIINAALRQATFLGFSEPIYEAILTPGSVTRGRFTPRFLSQWLAVQDMVDVLANAHGGEGIERLGARLMFLSMDLTWSYYLEHRRLWALLRLLPQLLATLRKWKLMPFYGSFLASGSPVNRAIKLAATAVALPLSFAYSGNVCEFISANDRTRH